MAATAFEGDAPLTDRVADGDWQGLLLIFERYHQAAYDLAMRTIRDPIAAMDVVESTFLQTWTSFRLGATATDLPAWLGVLARKTALDDIQRTVPTALKIVPEDDVEPFISGVPTDPPGGNAIPDDHEMARIVWQVASALSPEDYSLLHLHLR